MVAQMAEYETVRCEIADGIGWVTLDRPEVMNAFDDRMLDELAAIWQSMRDDDRVRCVVLTGAGDRAFCTGVDRSAIATDTTASGGRFDSSSVDYDDPGTKLGPKRNDLWKPVIAAINGIACGGALYLLAEADIVIAADHATFFDPHVSYGMPASYESMLMVGRMPLGELLRMQLTGAAERISAERAYQIGLASEVVPYADLHDAAQRLASTIAASPPLAVQATLRAVWAAVELGRKPALDMAYSFIAMGLTPESLAEGQRRFTSGERIDWRLR
jgi:enoyl-CoA hydratase/carnithine racemase